MVKYYDNYEWMKMKENETFDSIEQLLEKFGWSFFSEDGANKAEAHTILHDCFELAAARDELVKAVAEEIGKLEKEIKLYREAGTQGADDKNEVLKYLVRYIRLNCEEELWKEYPEFDYNHYKRGC